MSIGAPDRQSADADPDATLQVQRDSKMEQANEKDFEFDGRRGGRGRCPCADLGVGAGAVRA